jgi:hypothetical protein
MKPFPIFKTLVIALTVLALSGLVIAVNADDKPKTDDYLVWILEIVEDIQAKVGDVLVNVASEADSTRAEVGSVAATAEEIERYTKDDLSTYVASLALQEVAEDKINAVADQVNFGLPLVSSKTEKAAGVAPAGDWDPVASSSVFTETGRTGAGLFHVVVHAGSLPPGASVSVNAFWHYDDGTQATIPICIEGNSGHPVPISAELMVCEFTADGYVIVAATTGAADYDYLVNYASTVTVP